MILYALIGLFCFSIQRLNFCEIARAISISNDRAYDVDGEECTEIL